MTPAIAPVLRSNPFCVGDIRLRPEARGQDPVSAVADDRTAIASRSYLPLSLKRLRGYADEPLVRAVWPTYRFHNRRTGAAHCGDPPPRSLSYSPLGPPKKRGDASHQTHRFATVLC